MDEFVEHILRCIVEQVDAATAITVSNLRKDAGKMLGVELAGEPDKYVIIDVSSDSGTTGWRVILHSGVYYATDMAGTPRAESEELDKLLDAVEEFRMSNPEEFGQ